MTVVPFRRRPRRPFPGPVEPPPALGGELSPAAWSSEQERLDDRRRMQQNLAALALVVLLVVTGAWLIERLRVYSHTMACIEAGHRNCAAIDPRHLPTR
jgi:hypothetical protein